MNTLYQSYSIKSNQIWSITSTTGIAAAIAISDMTTLRRMRKECLVKTILFLCSCLGGFPSSWHTNELLTLL